MYVLEGVTPWIQSMQLQAGDTVIFSRREPEGKLVLGFRKASSATAVQDTHVPSIPDGAISKETFYSGVIKNLPIINGYPALLQSLKGNTDPHVSAFSQHLNSSDGSSSWAKTSKSGDSPIVDFQLQPTLPEMQRSHTIGSKSKRLHIDTDDALELMLTWEEAQDLLQPPPSVKPRIVVIEDQELEEYEEPPVFGKKTIFTSQLSRSSCSAPEELSSKGLDILLRSSRDSKRRKNAGSYKSASKCEASGLNAVAMTAVLCDDEKHQPGCTCIVCIRPPNGQSPKHEGPKHERSCMCNGCMTVRFRCQALKVHKKTQSEQEVESAIRKEHVWSKDDVDGGSALRRPLPQDPLEHHAMQLKDSESGQSKIQIDMAKLGKGQIDLKCHPERKEDPQTLMVHVSKMSSLQAENLPLETYKTKCAHRLD
ncbi:hypothetical protein MRB53_033103 [Persea americana]|uniref:Uncharacterized protein n=1 Tax=Persea americana TaxID=3435 RepID=A0ACC2KTY3_PERAE|nr:hypothetical protein MRB53_033103 [Persea americana]